MGVSFFFERPFLCPFEGKPKENSKSILGVHIRKKAHRDKLLSLQTDLSPVAFESSPCAGGAGGTKAPRAARPGRETGGSLCG